LIAHISKESDRKKSIVRDFALNGNPPQGLIPRALFLGEIIRLFLLNCEQSSRNNLFEWSEFKRNRRNNSHFAEKKRTWNQAFKGRFPLGGILRAERNFSLSCNFSGGLIRKDKQKFRSARRKFRLVENDLNIQRVEYFLSRMNLCE
jgi:hypothetical protein